MTRFLNGVRYLIDDGTDAAEPWASPRSAYGQIEDAANDALKTTLYYLAGNPMEPHAA